jgi:hypothetical protein
MPPGSTTTRSSWLPESRGRVQPSLLRCRAAALGLGASIRVMPKARSLEGPGFGLDAAPEGVRTRVRLSEKLDPHPSRRFRGSPVESWKTGPSSRPHRAAAGRPLRDGVVRNLPAEFAGATFHPPVAAARAVPNLQDGPEESRVARVTVLARARVAEGGRIIGVEPNTTVGGLLIDCEEDRTSGGARRDVAEERTVDAGRGRVAKGVGSGRRGTSIFLQAATLDDGTVVVA